ncbi:hypothetical protein M427DRAFT_325515 [Gonapodya prolifera JEL478]|uniref:Uncharacterized protein n=1 Tax=Gonapodya prolifera (strain JEL478) TaxID=1344416 RepID=A0A139AF63_GONPJ|nr:hypothetical protein M427DRAFT_325515 [Gonapodya prolifera JEL478]|eukprot:KXS15462.1 hypothetical protein M427DRAFT_325515 [Gonapodya prolifera JEL478]
MSRVIDNVGKVAAFHGSCLAESISPFQTLPNPKSQSAVARLNFLDQTIQDWYDSLPQVSKDFRFGMSESLIPVAIGNARTELCGDDNVPRLGAELSAGDVPRPQPSYFLAYLQILYRTVGIALHRPPHITTMARDATWLTSPSFYRACVHATELTNLLETMLASNPELRFIDSFSTYGIFQGGVIHFVNVKSLRGALSEAHGEAGSEEVLSLISESRRRAAVHVRALSVMGRRWNNAKLLADLLTRLDTAPNA